MSYTVAQNDNSVLFTANSVMPDKRPKILFAKAEAISVVVSICLLGGLFVPLSWKIHDIFLGLTLCLTFAVILIGYSARKASELSSLPRLLVFLTCLRLFVIASSVRILLTGARAGIITRTFAGAMEPMVDPISILSPVLILVGLWYIIRSVSRMLSDSAQYAMEVPILKRISIDTDLQMGVITVSQASEMHLDIQKETITFFRMAGAAKIIRAEAVLCSITTGVIILWPFATAMFFSQPPTHLQSVQYMGPYSVSILILWLLPAVITAGSVCHLLKIINQTGIVREDNKRKSKKVTIVSEQSGKTEEVEILNPDFADNIPTGPDQSAERIVEFEPRSASVEDMSPSVRKFVDVDQYYEHISNTINKHPEARAVLLCSENRSSLPVTIAVNTAIRRCSEGSVLLIDADADRNAVADVFDLSSDSTGGKFIPSGIKNLSLWLDSNKSKVTGKNLRKVIEKAARRYDKTIIYAPDLTSIWSWNDLVNSTGVQLVFHDPDAQPLPIKILDIAEGRKAVAIPDPTHISR